MKYFNQLKRKPNKYYIIMIEHHISYLRLCLGKMNGLNAMETRGPLIFLE